MKPLLALLCLAALLLAPSAETADYPYKVDLQTSRTLPYTLIGQLYFASGRQDYLGSAVAIKDRSVLTAGHNLYDAETGWSTELELRRGAYGNSVLSEQYASRVYLLSGYRARANYFGGDDIRTFALDLGGLRFPKAVAGGAFAGWSTDVSLITNSAARKMIIGYGAEGANTGDYPLTVSTQRPFSRVQGAFLESNEVYFEGGMSGGPIFVADGEGNLVVTGVVVSASKKPTISGGVRVLNKKAANLIQKFLQ